MRGTGSNVFLLAKDLLPFMTVSAHVRHIGIGPYIDIEDITRQRYEFYFRAIATTFYQRMQPAE